MQIYPMTEKCGHIGIHYFSSCLLNAKILRTNIRTKNFEKFLTGPQDSNFRVNSNFWGKFPSLAKLFAKFLAKKLNLYFE